MQDNLYIKATAAHKKNDLKKAKSLYKKLLIQDNKNFNVLFLLGTLFLQEKNFIRSIFYLSNALNQKKDDFHTLMNLGVAYKEQGEFDIAESHLNLALKLNSNDPNIFNNLGNLYLSSRQFEKSLHFFTLAVQKNPFNYSYSLNLADCYLRMSFYKESITTLQKIPPSADCFVIAQKKLFNIFFENKNYKQCILIGEDLIAKLAKENNLIFKMIQSYLACGKISNSKQLLKLLDQNTQNEKLYRALILIEESKYEKAKVILESLCADENFEHISHHNLGVLNFRTRNYESAINHFKKAIMKKSDFLESKIQLGLCQLSQCNFIEGWDYFFSYQDQNFFNNKYISNLKKWNNFELNKKILIIFDQGIGDQIFFSSLMSRLDNSNQYYCVVDKKLLEIFKHSFAIKNFHFIVESEINNTSKYDFYIRATELGKLFIKNKSDLKSQKKFLIANQINSLNNKSIGLSWYSNNQVIGRKKSIELEDLIIKLKHKNKNFVNLQYGDFNYEIDRLSKKHEVTFIDTHIDNLNNISGLASLIIGCDEIYTISNTTAHLAGALGVKVNLLLPFNHQTNTWYWSADENNKSLWYPTVNIFEAKNNEKIASALDKIK